MPTVTEQEIAAYAHCNDPRCYGYKQESVTGLKTVTEYTYMERGGTLPGVELGTEMVRFADEASDGTCKACDGPRGISEQKRPEYAHQSGQAQDALLHLGRTDAEVKDLRHASEIDKLERDREMDELRAQVAALMAERDTPKRGPGRPPKAAE